MIQMIDLVAGARPNFMKLAPVVRVMEAGGTLSPRIVHTGQHYDNGMNGVFFKELGIPEPDVNLEVGSGSHGAQTARILERYEAHLMESPPAATVVFGDVNSTVACALAAVKLGVPVIHVEAGLRSFDRTMPEEINRVLTDAIADLLLVSEASGVENLQKEGISREKIKLVGNVMIDTLLQELPTARAGGLLARLGLERKSYGLVTMHRPSNVDDRETLERNLHLLRELSRSLILVFPIHPRTKAAAERFGINALLESNETFIALQPAPYRENLALMEASSLVITDSGGIQEETSVLNVPCITLRENTERPITLSLGTSRLVGNDPVRIRDAFSDVLEGRWRKTNGIPLWDGHTAERVVDELTVWAGKK